LRDDLEEGISSGLQRGTSGNCAISWRSNLADLEEEELVWDCNASFASQTVPLQEDEDVKGKRSGFLKTSPFDSSQFDTSDHYSMNNDPVLV